MNLKTSTWTITMRAVICAGVVAGVVAVATLIASSSASAARPAHTRTATGPKPTIVLVHGAWADSGSWGAVVRRLQADGYTVDVPPNPLQGLAYDSATVADFLHTIAGPIVLVGHSYGGAVITNAATGDSQVKALVFVDAFVPAKGETIPSLVHGGCFAVQDLSTVFNFVPFPGAPSGVFDAYVKPSVFPRCFANGFSAADASVLAATQRPLSTQALGEPSGVPAWKTIPSWDVVGTDDHVIPEADQLAMARRAHSHITLVDAPHLSMISNPRHVARVIERAARVTG